MRTRVMRLLRGNRRVGRADLSLASFCSPLVIDGQRPRWIYRTESIGPIDSGWRFFEGGETEEFVNADGNCVLEHLHHMPERWPELLDPLADERERSAWEWDDARSAYVEVARWSPPF